MDNASKFYIDGRWVEPAHENMRALIDPSTEREFASIAIGSAEDVDKAVAAARRAFPSYSKTSVPDRIALLEKIGAIFRRREQEIAEIVTKQMGMTKALSSTFLLDWCRGNIDLTIDILRDFEFVEKRGTTTVYKEPIGVAGLITPWNFPIGLIFTKVLPALATGCTIVCKPSELTPLDGIIFAEIMDEAGVPAGVFNLVNGDGPSVGEAISRHPGIDMISFTGSTRAGIQITKAAADTVKRVTCELGGKSANIILDDADLDSAIENALAGCFLINGQACDAPTRLLVPRKRLEEVVRLAADAAAAYVVGAPSDPHTTLGPVMNANQFKRVQEMIQIGIDEGARLVAGGTGRPDGLDTGYFVKPTVFADVSPDMRIFREEIFGPVLSITAYDDLDEVIDLANDTIYGLAAHITGKDMDIVRHLAREMRAGSIYLNSPDWDPRAPFGGYKQSGNGRECGEYGFADFLEIKAVIGHG